MGGGESTVKIYIILLYLALFVGLSKAGYHNFQGGLGTHFSVWVSHRKVWASHTKAESLDKRMGLSQRGRPLTKRQGQASLKQRPG